VTTYLGTGSRLGSLDRMRQHDHIPMSNETPDEWGECAAIPVHDLPPVQLHNATVEHSLVPAISLTRDVTSRQALVHYAITAIRVSACAVSVRLMLRP